MNVNLVLEALGRVPKPLQPLVEWLLYHIPYTRREIDEYKRKIIAELRESLKSKKCDYETHKIPSFGYTEEGVLRILENLKRNEKSWQYGLSSGAVYRGYDQARLANEVYEMYSDANPLHPDIWPSMRKFEREIISMTAYMLGAGYAKGQDENVCGVVTSGGTESILKAMVAYRNFARGELGIKHPGIVAPETAHAAFRRASELFGMPITLVSVGSDCRADVRRIRKAIRWNTAVIVGSAPTFPHGAIDPIEELSELARERGIGFHTDACLGGFMLPWAKEKGYHVPKFDFCSPGVTSISADTHKYGLAPKGSSVLLFRTKELFKYSIDPISDWSGGFYATPTLAGSRSGALIAACWATMVRIGKDGYREYAARVLKTADYIKKEISKIPELRILGDPIWVIALTSDAVPIYSVLGEMEKRGWHLNGLLNPPAIHICLTLHHTQVGVASKFVADLKASVREAKNSPGNAKGMAAIYGTAAKLPAVLRRTAEDILREYIYALYEIS